MTHYACYTTPLGVGVVSQTEVGVLEVVFPSADRDDARRSLKEGIGGPLIEVPRTAAAEQLEEFFAGKRTRFELALDLRALTPFQRSALEACAKIPFGETSTYGQLAREIDRPNSARAVGQAMRRNPIPIIIPCHRVLASNNTLHGYAGGLDLKRRLLEFEAHGARE